MQKLGDDILSGVPAIAEELNFTNRKTYGLLEKGAIPAFKLGGKWHSRKSELRARMSADAA